MKSKISIMFIVLILAASSCKKDEVAKVSEEDLNVTVEAATNISTGVQTFVTSSLAEASEDGFSGTVPSVSVNTKSEAPLYGTDYSWAGPDADGWYTRSMSGVYEYYEKVRFRDTIDYVMKISYDGADATYENTTTTQFIKYEKDGKELYKGFSRWDLYTSGYSHTARVVWKISFDEWNADSGAGIYDWYWGVPQNSGGDIVPYYRFEHLTATETQDGWLHCHVKFYDEGNVEIWDYEYDTPWVPVQMPELPVIDK